MAATPSGYAVQAADGQGPLPPGWQHITNQGRSFYYHAATDVSQWTRPKDDEVPHPEPLPDGWEQVTDGEDVFYYHAKSDTSTWERPHLDAPDLPPNWKRCHDSDGDAFYHNVATGVSTWTKPTHDVSAGSGAGKSAPAPAAAARGSNGATANASTGNGDAGVSEAELQRREKARAARQVAVDAIARAEKSAARRRSLGGEAEPKKRRSSWKFLRAMVKTRIALNKELSKAKRRRLRRGVFAGATGDEDSSKDAPLEGDPPSTPSALAAIRKAMDHYLFQSLPQQQRESVLTGMRHRHYKANDTIITQGHTDSHVFVLESGKLEFVVDNGRVGLSDVPGKLFGELALLYDAPRAATVNALEDSDVWVMTASTFRRLVREAAAKEQAEKIQLIQNVPMLVDIATTGAGVGADPQELLAAMASELSERSFAAGQTILEYDAPLQGTYIIKTGSAISTTFYRELESGDFFGVADYRGETVRSPEEIVAGDDGVTLALLHRTSLRLLVQGATARTEKDGDSKTEDVPRIELSEYDELGPLGEGSFGVVKMVRYKGEVMALKALSKHHIAQARQVSHVIRERRLLGSLSHPFVVNLRGTSIAPDKLYMLLELVQGGELWSLIYSDTSPLTKGEGGMASDAARFYAANIILGLEYLHSQGIAFRDLKPENLLVTSKGYLKFVDFGFAKRIPFHEDGVLKLKSGTMLGSPDYLAPELILRHGHDHTVDLWALGVIVYELIAGKPAFDEENRNAGYERACRADVVFSDKVMAACPGGVSLVKDLLVVESHDRCGAGANGMAGLKAHAWFKGLDWEALATQTIPAPFVPAITGADDRSNFEVEDDEDDDEDAPDLDVPFTGDQSIWADF